MKKINVAIDGTSGVGKSSIADLLADKYGMIHLDTGAMYRAVALAIMESGIDLADEKAIEELLEKAVINFDEEGKIHLNGKDVSKKIREDKVSLFASKTAALAPVRKHLVKLQQQITKNKGYIVDGRDICEVVLPDAEVKVFMAASAKARAMRRYKQNLEAGMQADYETIYQDIVKRDEQDSTRAISPLKKAEDAALVDTSDLNIEQVVDALSVLIDHALEEGNK